ncbi:hypothetical protein RchiOBHm_Chr6g0292051 [Rosa chinensis]|uniref:Uncharacterized protein n=1 Tax=Rosa chinensis TaxID=74649 RepID=A0A2P6PWC9_ROSCH|nr:hypothetical protein RchiOBHm_Chr6g0292051 [Rosa chinensis]
MMFFFKRRVNNKTMIRSMDPTMSNTDMITRYHNQKQTMGFTIKNQENICQGYDFQLLDNNLIYMVFTIFK